MAKIWEKGYSLDELVERFTVGIDYILDRRLVAADAIASIAHARMLASIGLLDAKDAEAIERELRAIAHEAVERGVTIERAQEDGHTWIESRLVDTLGDGGKRIHTGRSRNDQVLASTRLFAREGLLVVRRTLCDTVATLLDFAKTHERVPMVGRTHLQPAMPSTVGLWAASFAETLLDADRALATAYDLVNRSPLGAAASYGVPLPLDRELVARELGFAEVHHNVLAAVSSRGQTELVLLDALELVGVTLGRLAADMILFALPEFGYFTLPSELCTGSSIMPQKRNPDGLELLRGKSATLSSRADLVRNVVRSLPSAYNRDVQETKEPLLTALDLAIEMLEVAALSVRACSVNEPALRSAFSSGVLATDEAIDLVGGGATFRDAYREVAAHIDAVEVSQERIDAAIARRTSTGTPGNLDLEWTRGALLRVREAVDGEQERVSAAVGALAGSALRLYPGAPTER